ncbi:hypothetical protein [Bradyrhizobium sp. BR 10289]|uniref:hypothetical protein n=1 Tax=Bradyrhizobium sp. BR 10289 TaxID=2749993 RepID=UPI001C6515E0|nr:hypothetical protein [Bradyrhizobium sp. BR 10289]MBW7970989.1 hypothetical protein [Bradyrhizobium sp. BR 10289]
MDLYMVVQNPDGETFDIVRNAPTVISEGLKRGEADALAFALNTQHRRIEGDLK